METQINHMHIENGCIFN